MVWEPITNLYCRISWSAVLGAYPLNDLLKQGYKVAVLVIGLVVCFSVAAILECIRISRSGTVKADLGNLPRIMKEWSQFSNAPTAGDTV